LTLCAGCGVTVQLSDAQVVVIEAERIALGDVVHMAFCRHCSTNTTAPATYDTGERGGAWCCQVWPSASRYTASAAPSASRNRISL
jgi:hypothetical protein